MGSIYSFYFSYGFMYVMGNYKKEDLGAAATAALSDTKLGFTAASKESAIIGFTAASKEGSKEANSMAEPYGLFGNFGYVSPPSLTNNNKSKSESEEAMKSRPKSPMSPLIMLDSSSSSSNSTPSDEERGLTKKNVGEEEPIEQVLKITPSVNRLCEEGMLIDQLMKEAIRRLNEFLTIRATPIPDSTILKYWSSEDEDMDPSKYFEKRMITLDADHKAAAGAGKKLYPSGFPVSMTIPEFLDKYGSLKAGQHMEWVTEYLAGKVMNKLPSSNLITYDLVGFGGQIQVMAFPKLSCMDEATFFQSHSDLKNGDYIGVIGFPGKSSMGELSVIPKIIVNLSYCLHKMPPVHYKKTGAWTPGSGRNPDAYILNDQETRYHRRFLDLTINPEVKDICKTRTKVVSYIRHFLENLGFLEVETPTLTVFPRGGGAKRGAFVTHHDDDLKMKMVMRNGDENVYLKQLVVGGIERVFEIGKQFRNNEGGVINDMMHNPEITTCEFYMALKTYKDLMELTEQILSGMVKEVTGGYKVMYHANGYHNPPIEIDFTPPFRRICMIEELEKMANLSIPKDLGSEEARQYLADACTKFGITCSSPQTTPRLLHKLVGHFLEVTRVVNPTFIIDPPEITSPLAKAHEDKQGLTERFILFVNKLEVANGYTVENDLVVQHQRFSDQLKSGNEEAMAALDDETFWMALEYGFPPTAAWVLDIDRLTMFLTDSLNIKEVVLFPAMKPQPHYKSPTIKGGKMVPTGGLNNDDFVEENDTSTVAVTIQEALTASKTLQRFLLQSQNTTPDDEYHLNAKLRDELELNLSKLFKK